MSETAPRNETEGQRLLSLIDTISGGYPSWRASFRDGTHGRFSVGVHCPDPLKDKAQQVILFNSYNRQAERTAYVCVQVEDLGQYMTFCVDSEKAHDVFTRDDMWPQDCSEAERLLSETDFTQPGPVLALREAYMSSEITAWHAAFVSQRFFTSY